MKRLLALVIAAALVLLYVLTPDPFGVRGIVPSPPRLEEAPLLADDEPPASPQPVAAAAAAPAAAAALPPARLAGRVTDLLGRGIEGAQVALFREPPTSTAGDTLYDLFRRVVPPVNPLYVVTTAADGAFELPPPGPGRFRVETTAPERALDVLAGIELTEEAPGGELEIPLAPGELLAGHLVDAEGHVVPRGVVLARAEATAAEPAVERTVSCDRHGRFRFPALPAGRAWHLLVRAEGWVAEGFRDVRLPQAALELILDRGRVYRFAVAKAGLLEPLPAEVLVREGDVPIAAGEVVVAASEGEAPEGGAPGVFSFRGRPSHRVSIHVQPERYESGLFQQQLTAEEGDLGRRLLAVGRPLVGVVVDADTGRGIADADVRVDHPEHAGILPPRWLRSGRHGEFTIAGYGGRGLLLAAFRDGHAVAGAQENEVLDGWPASDLRLALRRLGSARGRVVGPRGFAAAEVELRVILPWQGMVDRVNSRVDGTFSLSGVPVGRAFRVVGWREGLGYGVSAPLQLDNVLTPGHINLQLAGSNRLRGRVVDGLGVPVAEARVRVETVEEQPLLVAEAVSGADGWFRVDGLAVGRFRLVAERAGHGRVVVEVTPVAGAFPEAELRAPRVCMLAGTVYAAGRLPAARVVVRMRRTDPGAVVGWGLSGRDGGFRLAGPGPGDYILEAAAPDGSVARGRATAGAGHAVLVLATPVEER